MSHMNGFSHQENNFQRNSERNEDGLRLIQEALLDFAPVRQVYSGGYPSQVAPDQSGEILQKAREALRRNDIQEAAQQLRREIDFCQAAPKMMGSPFEISARAGLEAIAEQRPAIEVDRAIQTAYMKAWSENSTRRNDFYPY